MQALTESADVPVALLSSDDWVPPSKRKTVDVFVSESEPTTNWLAIVDHLLSLRFLFQPLDELDTGEDRSEFADTRKLRSAPALG